MNEKLKQLAKRIPHWRVSENPPNGATVVYDSEPYGCGSHIGLKSLEEFAELIVRECCEVLREEVEVALSAVGDVAYPERLIRKHFGVKE